MAWATALQCPHVYAQHVVQGSRVAVAVAVDPVLGPELDRLSIHELDERVIEVDTDLVELERLSATCGWKERLIDCRRAV